MTKAGTFKTLNIEAAAFAETMLVVRARLVEAAAIMAHISVAHVFPAKMRCHWPQTLQENIGGHDPAYGKNAYKPRFQPDATALSRAEDVMTRFLPKIDQDSDRKLVSGWATCLATPRKAGSFSQYCRQNGLVKRTAERRLNAIILALTTRLLADNRAIAAPDWRNLPALAPKQTGFQGRQKTYWRAADARPPIAPS